MSLLVSRTVGMMGMVAVALAVSGLITTYTPSFAKGESAGSSSRDSEGTVVTKNADGTVEASDDGDQPVAAPASSGRAPQPTRTIIHYKNTGTTHYADGTVVRHNPDGSIDVSDPDSSVVHSLDGGSAPHRSAARRHAAVKHHAATTRSAAHKHK